MPIMPFGVGCHRSKLWHVNGFLCPTSSPSLIFALHYYACHLKVFVTNHEPNTILLMYNDPSLKFSILLSSIWCNSMKMYSVYGLTRESIDSSEKCKQSQHAHLKNVLETLSFSISQSLYQFPFEVWKVSFMFEKEIQTKKNGETVFCSSKWRKYI